MLTSKISALFHRTSTMTTTASALKKTLKDFGYKFKEGQLRKLDADGNPTEDGFEFNISDDPNVNQKNYEDLGEVIDEYVYELLEKEQLLHKIPVPNDVPQDQASFVFASQNPLKSPKKLLILIHGSGVVRAGQWARRLIINESLNHGTQIPYIEMAKKLGYEVLVTNTNDNFRMVDGQRKSLKLKTPEEHISYVFENIVVPSNAESIAIVAHSYGGVLTVNMAEKYKEIFESKVFGIGLTDSVHYKSGPKFLKTIAKNWVSSSKELDFKLGDDGIPRVSAGHKQHEYTSYSCIKSLFKFLEDKYIEFKPNQAAKKQKMDL